MLLVPLVPLVPGLLPLIAPLMPDVPAGGSAGAAGPRPTLVGPLEEGVGGVNRPLVPVCPDVALGWRAPPVWPVVDCGVRRPCVGRWSVEVFESLGWPRALLPPSCIVGARSIPNLSMKRMVWTSI